MVGSTEECTWIVLTGSSTSDEKMCIDVAERLYTEGIGRKREINLPNVGERMPSELLLDAWSRPRRLRVEGGVMISRVILIGS